MIKAIKGEFELRDNGSYWSVVKPVTAEAAAEATAKGIYLTNYVVCVGKEKYVRGKWNRIAADGKQNMQNVYIPPTCR